MDDQTQNTVDMDSTKTLQELIETYCKAANALNKYRSEHGFESGARVIARYREEPELRGTIARYGKAWSDTVHFHVPVLLDNGRLQSWSMADLTLEASSVPKA